MFFFFFQAEDGIRDKLVTGVQTCALPIFGRQDELRLHVFELPELVLAADESRQLDRQVGETPRQGPYRRKPSRMVKIGQLEDLFGALEVLEEVQPEIP